MGHRVHLRDSQRRRRQEEALTHAKKHDGTTACGADPSPLDLDGPVFRRTASTTDTPSLCPVCYLVLVPPPPRAR